MTNRPPVSHTAQNVSVRSRILPYVIVAKPGIVAMVLVATLSGMYMAQGALPHTGLIFWTLLGIGLATAGAAALNNYYDRDIDIIMRRTKGRPLPSGAASPGAVLVYGLAFSALSLLVMAELVNFLAASLTAAAIFIYVVAYTILSKRTTPLATYIGGVGGALPPVIGYAAASGSVDVYALTLFLIIFAWQHPHFWSLSLKYREEYKSAGVSNHPVKLGVEATKRRIALWAAILALVSTLPYFLGMAGVWYLACAMAIGAAHTLMSVSFALSDRKVAMSLFFFSIVQLPALFCVMLLDIIA